MKLRLEYSVPLLVICILTMTLAWTLGTTTNVPSGGSTQGLSYGSAVYIYKNGELISQSENLLFTGGNETVETALTGGTIGTVQNITLCDASTGCGEPLIGDGSETWNEYTDCGLSGALGTITDQGTGNFSVANTFTSTCDGKIVNVTRISNATASAGVYFAGNNFTSVTLQTADQLTVTWYIWIS